MKFIRGKNCARCLLTLIFFISIYATTSDAAVLTTSVIGGNDSILSASGEQGSGVVELTTLPDPGFRTSSWTGTNYDTNITPYNYVTMDSDKTVTVEFETIPVELTETQIGTRLSNFIKMMSR